MQNTAKAVMEETGLDIEAVDDLDMITLDDMDGPQRLGFIASSTGDLTPYMSDSMLADVGAQCIEGYENDCSARDDWKKTACEALKKAKQEPEDERLWPWKGASNASFPLLTTAALQFAARAYPAIVKGDEAVSCKVVGSDKGLPKMGPDGSPMMTVNGMLLAMTPEGPALVGPQGAMLIQPEQAEQVMQAAQPVWERAPGAKTKRAQRVKEFMNYTIFYRMKGWEEDTDILLHHLPIIGCGFRKVYYAGEQRSEYVSALKLVAPMDAKSCEESPRLTEERDAIPLNDIISLQRAGFYRDVQLVDDENSDGLRMLLEQHCLLDLDGDGYKEPYVVTLDSESQNVLRVEANFGPDDVQWNGDQVVAIRRECYYVKYDFFPNFDGGFYGLGLGHLLQPISKIVDSTIRQMIDAGTAAAAGGGFIGSGVDLAGGRRSSSLQFAPGNYKTVNVSGSKMREAIYERTFPGPNPVTFQVLELMLGAAKDIAATSEVLVGNADNKAPVGTTLALIEQGLQVFTAIYKRVFRALKEEYSKLFANIGKYGGEEAKALYLRVLDDPEADFEGDFAADDFDIRPVSDPSSVTRAQRIARAQFIGTFLGAPGMNPVAIIRRMLEAADVEDIEELFAEQQQPDPMAMAMAEGQLAELASKANRNNAAAQRDIAQIGQGQAETAIKQDEEQRKQYESVASVFQQGLEIGARPQ